MTLHQHSSTLNSPHSQTLGLIIRRSKVRIYYHFVWATQNREWFLSGERERAAYRLIESLARAKKCVVLALNGMPDHVHLLVSAPATISASLLMHHIKGVSSASLRENQFAGEAFGWQDNYGVFSLSKRDLEEVIAYVENQKSHHEAGKLKASLEDTDED